MGLKLLQLVYIWQRKFMMDHAFVQLGSAAHAAWHLSAVKPLCIDPILSLAEVHTP